MFNSNRTDSRIPWVIESLEHRTLLQATLFVDFGDNFPGGTLATTQGAFRDVANDATANNRILGTTLLDNANGFSAGTALNVVAQTFTATERAQMMAVVRRAYLPLEIDVIELTATVQTTPDGRNVAAATNMADVINTLRAGPAGSRDAYVFVATFVVDPGGTNQATYGPGGGGNSPGGPNGTTLDTTDLAAAANNHDDVAVVYSSGGFSNNTLNNIAHEAGHLFGLQHSITNATGIAATDLLHQAEVMSYRNTNNTTSTIAFTRYPMIRGDDNSPGGNVVNYNDLAARGGQVTLYDQARLDGNILPNPSFSFISGTGAHDIITITRNGGNADVTIQAFADVNYTTGITVPGEADTTYSYSFALTDDILIFAGDSTDRIVLDADLGVNVQIDGMLGTDSLVINGKNAANVVYTPNATAPNGVDLNASFGGTISIGSTSIAFANFETNSNVTISDVTTLNFVSGGSSDSLTLTTPAAGQIRVAGTSDAVSVVPLTFFNVTNFALNSGTNDGAAPNDLIVLNIAAPSTGLQTLAVNGGSGDDELRVDFSFGNPIPTGGISYDGGTGSGDRLVLRGGSFTNEIYTATGASSGNISLDGSVITFSNLAPIDDTVVATNFIFNAPATDDIINIVAGPTVNSFATTQINSGNSTFELINFANKSAVVVNGQAGDDTINLTAQAGFSITVNGGTHTNGDRLNLDGEGSDFDFTEGSLTTALLMPVLFSNIETVGLADGEFTAAGTITPNVVVDDAATLVGEPSITGTLGALAGGTISPGIGGAGTITAGGLSMIAGATLAVDLNGTTPDTEHDQLVINGTVSLGGATLSATLGFTPLPGEDIVLIRNDNADAVTGTFAEGALATFNGIKFAIDYAFDADVDGNLNDVAMIRYGAALGVDPCDPTKQALYVSATTGEDLILIVPQTGNPRATVLINDMDEGSFAYTGLTIIFGQAGNDTIRVLMPARRVIAYGNAGHDWIETGNSHGILLGGIGNDTALGGNASDILIGGKGNDYLKAQNAGDILIAGYSPTYEANTSAARHALCMILNEWVMGSGGYTGRISHITNGGGRNGAHVFNDTTLFHEIGETNVLVGGAARDWFFMNSVTDTALHRHSTEVITELL